MPQAAQNNLKYFRRKSSPTRVGHVRQICRFVIKHSLKLLVVTLVSAPFIFDFTLAQIQEGQPPEKMVLAKKDFQANEEIKISLENATNARPQTFLIDQEGSETPVTAKEEIVGQDTQLTVDPPTTLKPGKYTLKVQTASGTTFTQDFTWGVLAINPNKSIYSPQEKASLAMAVLDEQGKMVCDAKLQLKIKNLELKIDDALSTENGTIRVNPECQVHDVTLKPDYEAQYQVGEVGIYEIELSAETKNGVYTISDFFEVRDFVPFDVERVTATRIYPPKPYPVTFNIKVNQDFEGVVEEIVPDGFEVKSQNCCEARISSSAPNLKVIEWEVSWKAGEVHQLGYEFKAPDISPQFYLLGPLQFKFKDETIFQEVRRWQLAADATLTLRPVGAGSNTGWSIGTGCSANWDCVEEVTTDNDSSYVRGQADGLYDTYEMSNPSASGTITNVRVYVKAYDAGGPEQIVPVVRMGTTNYDGTGTALTGSYADYSSDWATNPAGGNWSWTDINNLEAGMKTKKSGGWGGDFHVTQVWVVVTYDLPANMIQDHFQWKNDDGYAGESQTLYYNPTGPGYATGLSIYNGSCVANWQCVDDGSADTQATAPTNNGDTSALTFAAATDYYTLADNAIPTGSTVTQLDISAWVIDTGNPNTSVTLGYCLTCDGNNNVTGSSQGISTASYHEKTEQFASLSLSTDDLNNIQLVVTGNGTRARISTVYVLVTYTQPSATTKAGEDISTGFTLDKNDNVRLRVQVDNSGEAASSYDYLIEWAAKVGGSCGDDESFAAIPVTATTEHFEATTSAYFSDGSNTVASQLSNAEAYTFTNGKFVADPSNSSGAVSVSGSQFTEFEYIFFATNNATSGGTYCFQVTNAGSSLQQYDVYPEITITSAGAGITLSGTIYTDEGISPYLCSSTGNLTVQLRVNGTGTDNATCTADTGRWTIAGVSAASGNTVVVYLDGGSVRGSLVFVTDNTSISDYTLPIYQNRVILRDDVNGSITNGEIHSGQPTDAENDDLYDSTATTYTTAAVTYETHIYGGDTFAPGGDVSTGKLHIPTTSVYSGNSETLTLSGSGATTARPLYVDSGTFTAPTTTKFTGTAASDIEAATYNNLQFLPSSGTPTYTLNSGTLATANNTTLTIGDATYNVTVTAATNNPTINVGGNLTLGSSSSFTKGSGTLTFNGTTGPYTWTDNNSNESDMGRVNINGSSLTINLGSSVSATVATVSASQTFGLGSSAYTLNITGSGTGVDRPFAIFGTLNEGTDSTVSFTSTSNVDIQDETYDNLTLAPSAAGGPTYRLATASSKTVTVSGDLTVGDGTYAVTVDDNTYDPTLDIAGNLTISAAATFSATDSNGATAFTVGGNWSNSGVFTHNSGLVVFDAGAGGRTINSGGTTNGVFGNIQFNNSAGGWTIQTDNLKAAGNLTITDTAASGFTVNSVSVEVGGTYSIADAETANTTWTSATLYLNSGTAYTVGSKTQTAETYSTLQVGANTDIRIWNSSASTYTVDSSGSLYSQDHAGTDGDLYVWGDYHVSTNDYWSYATDFDGTALGGSGRQVDVRIDPAAVVTVDSGDTLAAVGTTSPNRTTVSRQGALNGYQIIVSSGGTINFQYTDFDYLDGNKGIDIQAGATVTDLSNTKYDNLIDNAADDAFVTVAASVIGAGTATFSAVQFDNNGSTANFNVNFTGATPSGYWDFDASTGTFDGEAYDGDDGANEADPGALRWDDSTSNQNPNLPSNLGPAGYLDAAGWMNDSTPTFNFDLSDPDAGQQVKFQIQIDDTSNFSSVVVDYTSALGAQGTFNFTVGQAAGSGTYSTGSESQTLSDSAGGGGYYWRVKAIDAASAESSYEEAGTDAAIDFRVDSTAPTGGTVYDDTETGVDKDFNNGSLSQLSANWSGFDSNTSGLLRYDYSIGTTVGGTDIVNWTSNSTDTSVTAGSLTLQTSQVYYFNVRALDNAGNTQSAVSSDGLLVSPTLTFGISPSSISFDNLNAGNSYTSTKAATLTTSTNAYNGYVIRAFATDNLRSIDVSDTIGGFDGGNYASPDGWQGGDRGFGYTSSDTSVQGANKFNSDPCPGGNGSSCYAPFSQTGPGEIVADHTNAVTGSPVSSEEFTITYKTVVNSSQAAGTYTTTIVYTITPQY